MSTLIATQPRNSLFKRIIARTLLPLSVVLSVSALLVGRSLGINLELIIAAVAIAILALAMLLERWQPFNPQWNRSTNDTATDLTSTAVLLGLVDPLLKYLAPVLAVATYKVLDLSTLYLSLVGQTPFWLQLVAVTLLIELARYWLHRLHHTVRALWWLHAMHHSSKRLYALNNFRFHPLNYLLMFMLSVFPLMVIGVPAEVLLGYLAFSLPVVMLQHGNIDLQNGALNYLFSTNELHRWHHSAKASEANCNYGYALIIWDLLFGTFKYYSDGNNAPATIGLFKSSSQTYPAQASYTAQLRSMFARRCCQ